MADPGAPRDEHADGRVRARGAARRRGDDDARALPVARVVLYSASGCRLCERALEVVEAVRAELGFELEVVQIDGDPVLEERYRTQLPVVEVDGEQAFTYFVEPSALATRLASR